MTLSQWLEYLESLHPAEIELGLDRIQGVADNLPLDFSRQKIICVGGTNGKGSTVSILASILTAAGNTVGRYTSPHLLHYNERVCINNNPVSDEDLCAAFEQVEDARANIPLTYFEFGTLAALILFSQQNLDYVLMEVGLGGSLDAVNILDADISIVTNVAIDHTDWLGDNREAIGHEKSGIYRTAKPALYGEQDIPESVLATINDIGAVLYQRGKEFNWSYSDDKKTWCWQGHKIDGDSISIDDLPVHGFALNYSLDNVALALQAICLLDESISKEAIINGLQQAVLAGRFQKLDRPKHTLVLDVAHNPHAASSLLDNLQTAFAGRPVRIVIAMLEDKDIAKVLKILKKATFKWYVAEIKEDRGSPAKILYNYLTEMNETEISCFDSIRSAFESAESEAKEGDVVLVTGSFYTVSTVLELI